MTKKAREIADIQSEVGVIATLVNHPDFIFFADDLTPRHFTNESNARYFHAISHLAKKGVPKIDVYNISVAFGELGVEPAPSNFEITEFLNNCQFVARSSHEEYQMLARNVLDKAFRREMLAKLKSCVVMCETSDEPAIQHKIYDVLDSAMLEYSTTNEVRQYGEVVDSMWAKIQERQHSDKVGYEFKFPALRDYVSIERGELVLFGAMAKQGKSIMLLNCAVDLLEKGASVLYVDSELSTEQFTLRLLSHLTGIEYRRIKYGNYSKAEEAKLMEAKEHMKGWKFVHKNLPMFDAQTIYAVAKKAKHVYDIDVIIVDYFKMNKEGGTAFETYMNGGALVDMVKNNLCSDLGIAGLGAVQLTRSGTVADSAKIERNCSTLIIMRPKTLEEIDDDGGSEYGTYALTVLFNRGGEQQRDDEYISLNFNGNRILFEEPERQPERREPV